MEILIFLGGFFIGALCVFIPFNIINRNNKNSAFAQNEMFKQMNEQMKLYFENTANKIFKESTSELSDSNKEKLEEFYKRFKERIEVFEKRAEENFKAETENFTKFDMNIKNFLETGNKISHDANSLVNVMKSDNRASGRWGEIVLERVLEVSGLRKDEEYKIQMVLPGHIFASGLRRMAMSRKSLSRKGTRPSTPHAARDLLALVSYRGGVCLVYARFLHERLEVLRTLIHGSGLTLAIRN